MSALEAFLAGPPLVVFSDVVLCDREHEHTIVTDGSTAYAWNEANDIEIDAVVRHAQEISGSCPVESRGETCGSTIAWNLAAEGCWSGDQDLIDLLVQFGKPIEEGDERP